MATDPHRLTRAAQALAPRADFSPADVAGEKPVFVWPKSAKQEKSAFVCVRLWLIRILPGLQFCYEVAQVSQTAEVVAGEEVIQVGEGGGHPFAKRQIVATSLERVKPDHAFYLPFQILHLRIEKRRVSPIPAIAEYEEKGPVRV